MNHFSVKLALMGVCLAIASSSFAQHDHGSHQPQPAPAPRAEAKMSDMSDMMEKMSHLVEMNAEINQQMEEMVKTGVMAGSKGMMNMYAVMQSNQELTKDMQTMMERMHTAIQDEAMLQDGKMKDLMAGMQKHVKEMQKHTEGLTHSLAEVNEQFQKKMPKSNAKDKDENHRH